MKKGFTLIELLIVLTVLGVLATMAYPSYNRYVVNARRAEAQSALLNLGGLMERYFSINSTYATATIAASNNVTDVLGVNTTDNSWYVLSITAQGATNYTVTATPQSAQATDDTECANFTINQLGVKGISGTGTATDCWS